MPFRHPLLFLSLLVAFAMRAQDTTEYVTQAPVQEERFRLKDRLWFGGGIGLNFGTVTAIQLDPLVGVHLDRNRKFSSGLGLSYWYYRDGRWNPPIEQNAYGYRVFSRYRVIEQAYLHAEFLHLNAERIIGTFEMRQQRIWVPHLLLGAGYVQPLGSGSSIYLQILFDVLQDPNSVYANQGPILSGGVGIGF
jgi:hypothetical protein